jgi:Family of unknown function (DUF6519)
MKGEFSRTTFSTRMRYGSVSMQQGRVQLDTDWNEKSELQLQPGLVYLDVWERDLSGATRPAAGHQVLRMIRDVGVDGRVASTLHASLGRATGERGASIALPRLEVTVEGALWKRVDSFSGSGPQDCVYVVAEDGGLSYVTFGDGKNGARPEEGSRVVASYRFGDGEDVPKAQKRGRSAKRGTK